MIKAWLGELFRLLGIGLAGGLFGLLMGSFTIGFVAVYIGYSFWQLVQLRRLTEWLRSGNLRQPPDAHALWADAYALVYRIARRNKSKLKKLKNVLSRFEETASALPDATVVLDEEGVIEWWNDAARDMLGLSLPQDVGQRIDNLVRHPKFVSYFRKGDFHDILEFPSPADSQMLLSVRLVPYGNRRRLLVAQDITRLHKLEQMRRDFVANISHELKTPLTVVSGFIETMQDVDTIDEKQWRRSLTLMQQQTARMRTIVDDLMFLSKLETKEATLIKKPVNVPALLATIRAEAQALSPEEGKHEFVLEADESLWLVGDESELRSAFTNLVVNAVRYSPEGGTIRIRWFVQRGEARLAVSDQGIGIPRQHIARLTERFYRVDTSRSRQSGGTGLGLAIVKHVLNRHQAQLIVDSVVDKGSTFTCIFPEEMVHRQPIRDSSVTESAASNL